MVKDRKHHIHMNGREVFKHAVRRFPEVILEGLNYNNIKIEDLGIVIPHQANFRITSAVQERLGVDKNKVFSNIHKLIRDTPEKSIITIEDIDKTTRLTNSSTFLNLLDGILI